MSPELVLGVGLFGGVADAITTRRGKRLGMRERGIAGRRWGEHMRRLLVAGSLVGCWAVTRWTDAHPIAYGTLIAIASAPWVVALINYRRADAMRERSRG